MDERDRKREKEELEEIRQRLLAEGHPDPEAEIRRVRERECVSDCVYASRSFTSKISLSICLCCKRASIHLAVINIRCVSVCIHIPDRVCPLYHCFSSRIGPDGGGGRASAPAPGEAGAGS